MNGTRSRFGFGQMRRWAIVLLAGGVLAAGFMPSGLLAVSPGPTFSLGEMVKVSGRAGPRTPFHMVTVAVEEANWFDAVWAAVNPRVAVWDEEAVTRGRGLGYYEADMESLMERSLEEAARLAFLYAGLQPTDEALADVSIENSDVLGPSAGLAFALHLSSILMEEDLAAGLPVAATGALDGSGRVLRVGGIAQKVLACRNGGIRVLLVPAADLDEASRYARDIRVIGVSSFEEAVEALRSLARSIP